MRDCHVMSTRSLKCSKLSELINILGSRPGMYLFDNDYTVFSKEDICQRKLHSRSVEHNFNIPKIASLRRNSARCLYVCKKKFTIGEGTLWPPLRCIDLLLEMQSLRLATRAMRQLVGLDSYKSCTSKESN